MTRAVLVSLGSPRFVAAAQRLGEEAHLLRDADLPDRFALLHLPGAVLGHTSTRSAVATARAQRALIAVDLADLEESPDARLAYDLAMLRPDILVVRAEQQAALGAPLEGLGRLPVVLLGDRGVLLFGRRVPAPRGPAADRDAFVAALCSAYLEGAMPVEAAARALVFAAGG